MSSHPIRGDADHLTFVLYDKLMSVETTYRNYKSHSLLWMAGKKEVWAVVVRAFKSFQIFPVPDGESEQSWGELELEGHQYGAGPDF